MPLFKLAQFIEMAVKDEETGEAFYNALAERTKSPEMKREYLKIAAQEANHKNRFLSVLEKMPAESTREEYEGQYQEYLNVLLSTKAFPQTKSVNEIVKDLSDDRDAVFFAMQMEKDTLLFYYGIRDLIHDNNKKIVDDIMREEQVHIEELSTLLTKI